MANTVTPEAEPPSYIEPPAFTGGGELPEYHRNAAADERIVLAQPQAPRPTTRALTEYIFRSPRLELNLGEKKWPVKVPCYGWKGTVKGTVLVKDFKAVSRITVTFEGACRTSVMERGMAVYNSSKTLVSKFQVLWTRQNNVPPPREPTELPFSFPIPTMVQGTSIRMPHSYATIHTGLNADITYNIRVDVFRKGLRRHERLGTMILYLPRSTPPEPADSISDIPQWDTIPIYPKYWLTPTKANRISQEVERKEPAEAINLVIPLPTIYASAAPIPFHLSFPSDSPLLDNLSNTLSVNLIKYTIIRAGGFLSVKDGIIGVGEIWRVEEESYPTPPPSPSSEFPSTTTSRKIYRGTLQSFREGGETSWNIPEFLEIRYSLRVRIRVDPTREGTARPEYFIDHPIYMCTHNRIPNAEDLHDPVIGLIAVAGSQGVSTTRAPTIALPSTNPNAES